MPFIEVKYRIMKIKEYNFRKGITLIELMITLLAAIILLIGITGILAAGHKNFWTMYKRINSDVVRNAYEARSIFDGIVRQASIKRVSLLSGGNELYVYYYAVPQDANIVDPDRYARFYLAANGSEQELMLAQGTYDWSTDTCSNASSTRIIAHNVVPPAAGMFSIDGGDDIQMILTLDNETGSTNNKLETSKITLTTTAIRHN
jgi:hypothetical protein